MAELIYNIKGIFATASNDDCLVAYDCECYHIASYQRGYKWASGADGAVTKLISDLYEAFNAFLAKERSEYYLQYITLKRNHQRRHMEVIDGQQRLTTLSVMLSVMTRHLETENLAVGKLEYAIRDNFLQDYIFNREQLELLLQMEWDHENGLVFKNQEPINNQDVFYIFEAAKYIDRFCLGINNKERLLQFYHFILEHVKLIVNAVENVSSEKVFSNLNGNKVALTEVELIKGLILTKYSRKKTDNGREKSFREILEGRMLLGRQWDEITRWCNKPEINTFFFNGREGMHTLLGLVASEINGRPIVGNENPKALFDFYHKLDKMDRVYSELLAVYNTLNEWYVNDVLYNLLGYLFFAKGSKIRLADLLKWKSLAKPQLRKKLSDMVRDLIPGEPKKLFYDAKQDNEIHRVLLALNVFSPGGAKRFDYHRFVVEKWTLEHIFPQTPEGKNQVLNELDKEMVVEMLGNQATDKIKKILKLKERTADQKEIYQNALKGIGHLNAIGNMCLLTNKDNISNSCGFFDTKRSNILTRIRKGSFVPKHTFDVFSKMIFETKPGPLERWTVKNIATHTNIIESQLANLILDNESR